MSGGVVCSGVVWCGVWWCGVSLLYDVDIQCCVMSVDFQVTDVIGCACFDPRYNMCIYYLSIQDAAEGGWSMSECVSQSVSQ